MFPITPIPRFAGRNAVNKPPTTGGHVPQSRGPYRDELRSALRGRGCQTAGVVSATGGVLEGAFLALFQALALRTLALSLLVALGALGLTRDIASAQGSDRHAAIVADANNGAVLHADQADELRYPASLTKIMTLYLAFEAIEQGRATYATRIKISQEAASQPPTKLDLDAGETIALIDAMKALITKSANDAAVGIAEHFGGTESRFAGMMTDKARLFGMSRTTFRNASGLPNPSQVTTARDMLKLALRLQDDFPKHYHLFSIRSFTYDGSTYRNHNTLLHRFQGTDGIKTGYTRASGFNLVSSVRRGGRHVIGVVLGGRTASRRDVAMQMLVSRALLQSSPYKTRKTAPVLVAVAKPAQRPEPVVRPAPAIQSAPALSAPPRVAEAPIPRPVMVPQRPRPAAQPVPAAAATQPAPTPPAPPAPVQAARRPSVPEVGAPDAGSPNTGAHESLPRFAFAPRGMGRPASANDQPEPAGQGAPETAARGAAPSTLQRQAADLSRAGPARDAAPAPAVAPVRVAAASPVGVGASTAAGGPARGAAPSTFQQQAAAMPHGSDAAVPPVRPAAARTMDPPYGVRGTMPPPGNEPISGGFEIQIGAFATAPEADRALVTARTSAGDLLQSRSGRTVPVEKNARRIFRARFNGFDSRTAASTCLELRRRQIDCFVVRAE